jgi:FecR protein
MSDDYLWDGTGTPGPGDRDVVKLERQLGPLRAPLPPVTLPNMAPPVVAQPFRAASTVRFWAPALAMAAAIVLMIASTYQTPADSGASWEVAQMDGRPRIESSFQSATLTGTGRLAVGQTLATDDESRARIDVSTIGQVTIDNNTRVRLVATREGRHELALARGTLHAFITAPPGQFIVNTPSATATDLGCIYTLHVDEDGTGLLSVTAGWVAFEYKGRESFVPAGASARTDRGLGPGTPRYDDSPIGEPLESFDRGVRPKESLAFVLEHASEKDAMTLWHLIARVPESDRAAVVDALDRRVPMPIGVTRDAVLHLNRAALDLWWDALGLRDATWWRTWKRPIG